MPWATPPATCPSTIVGLIMFPQSCTHTYRCTVMLNVVGSTSTIAPCTPYAQVACGGE